MFVAFGERYGLPSAARYRITASNDINEEALVRLNREGHEIDAYGIGTHLVTCQKQPALDGVFKLVEVDGRPRVKVSDSIAKRTLPAKKDVFRIYDGEGREIADLITLVGETPTVDDMKAIELYPESDPVLIHAARIEPMFVVAWGDGQANVESVQEVRARVMDARAHFNKDILTVRDVKSYRVLISMGLEDLLARLVSQIEV